MINRLLIAVSAMAWTLACTAPENNTKEVRKFPVVRGILKDTTLIKEYVADIQSLQNVDIRTRIKGFIDKVYVDEGQTVESGQVLFSISAEEFKEALLSAKALTKNAIAELKTAEIELSNAESLAGKSVISKSQLQLARSKVEAHQAKLEEARANEANAQLNLSFTEIKAPFSGIINRIPFKKGSLVDEGALLTTLSNNKEIFAYFRISEKDFLDHVRRKDKGFEKQVRLELANGELYEYPGKIETVEGEIEKETGNIAFRARFPNPLNQLRHGGTGKVLWPEFLLNALLVPQKSVFEIQDKNWVYVVGKDNKVELRSVRIGSRLPGIYAIESGLSESDLVLYEGIQLVSEGDAIFPEKMDFNSILKTRKPNL